MYCGCCIESVAFSLQGWKFKRGCNTVSLFIHTDPKHTEMPHLIYIVYA